MCDIMSETHIRFSVLRRGAYVFERLRLSQVPPNKGRCAAAEDRCQSAPHPPDRGGAHHSYPQRGKVAAVHCLSRPSGGGGGSYPSTTTTLHRRLTPCISRSLDPVAKKGTNRRTKPEKRGDGRSIGVALSWPFLFVAEKPFSDPSPCTGGTRWTIRHSRQNFFLT
jgi:hypothetical protein